ncbi:ShlB/FhaC/HecB family hemolysin secretion/activation protein [Methylotuvimicrobium buryatense]|uniref:ShlB/FhaC/HecB family hemolysin secretion/activation protein n=1 Tax=Methylotuvimicrobium buryatense TaxID=95641 RepID=A0A4P9UKY5_METBY|nr:POTRA domain-containing protein [Methylotuvimicrobium buryatense]QCW81747.1 ShlB/FhaC/HecB family hemolysin secretion/activation protein [Methylotuvimicrobium buryatense]
MIKKVFSTIRWLVVVVMCLTSSITLAEDENHFDLWELRVKGNTLLDRKTIERGVYPFLGEDKSIDTVEQARASLEKIYHSQGYQTVAVDIPEQDVVGGVVYLEVTEGKVSRLRVTDSRYFSLGRIKAKIPELAEGKVPNIQVMQQQLADLGKESSDRSVVPILRAGETPGTVEVDLKVKDSMPIHGKVEVNGRNVANTSRLRTIASLRYDNLWQKFHSASFMYQTSPEKPEEVEVFVGTYVMPLLDTDAKLALYAVSSSSDSQIASAGALSVIGTGDIYGARLILPLTGKDHYSHSFTLGVDYKSFAEDLNLLGADTLKTPITYLPFMAQYNGTVSDENSLLSFNLGVNFSIRGLGNDEQEFADKRFLAKPNYLMLNGGIDYKYNLPWGMDFVSRISGQIADSPIISNEQYSIGGDDSVRGYFETQVLSDDGVQGSIELYSPRLLPFDSDWEAVNTFRGLVFLDAGRGWIKSALPGIDNKINLASGGVGLRFQAWKYLVANLDVAFPFISQGTIESGDPRLHFRVAAEF